MNIEKVKATELQEVRDFLDFINDFGHVFYLEEELLDKPFSKILEGIEEIKEIIKKDNNV